MCLKQQLNIIGNRISAIKSNAQCSNVKHFSEIHLYTYKHVACSLK